MNNANEAKEDNEKEVSLKERWNAEGMRAGDVLYTLKPDDLPALQRRGYKVVDWVIMEDE